MQSIEVRTKISNTMKQLRKEGGFSIETRNKISQKLKGNQHFKGHKRTSEAIEKPVKAYVRKFIVQIYQVTILKNLTPFQKALNDEVKMAIIEITEELYLIK